MPLKTLCRASNRFILLACMNYSTTLLTYARTIFSSFLSSFQNFLLISQILRAMIEAWMKTSALGLRGVVATHGIHQVLPEHYETSLLAGNTKGSSLWPRLSPTYYCFARSSCSVGINSAGQSFRTSGKIE